MVSNFPVVPVRANRNIIQRFENTVLHGIVDALWHIQNDNLYKDVDV